MIFVVSDFHGNLNAWESLKKALNAEDTCYVLGDACDRGKHGVQILSEIKEDKRFRYIVGNHDDFVIRTFRPDLVTSKYITSEWAKNCWLKNQGPSCMEWIELANSNPTKFKELVEWLANCDAFSTVYVEGKIFRLAHAKYPKQIDARHMSWKDMEKYHSQILFSTIWDRYRDCISEEDIHKMYVSEGCITLIGHTPIYNRNPKIVEGLYNLDTGLCYGYDEVSVFCMNDCKIYTIKKGSKLPKGSNEEKKIIDLQLRCFYDISKNPIYDIEEAVRRVKYGEKITALGYCTDHERGFNHACVQTSTVQQIIVKKDITLIVTRNSIYRRI